MLSGFIWDISLFGTDVYHLIASFVIFSIIGWFVESVYMSFCEKKITNRGFAKGPFCPIYGFGCTLGYLLLKPFSFSYLLVYIIGLILATSFEYLVGILMIKLLGSLWWDYNDKPYNYKGIICLESTIAWGFYGIGVVFFLFPWVMGRVDLISVDKMRIFIIAVLFIAVVDYIFQLMKVFKKTPETKVKVEEC